MNALAGSGSAQFDEVALKRGVESVRHPLTRALLALTFTAGLIDAVCFLGLGRVFTANMTGNVVLLGFGVAGSGGLPVVAPLLSLAAFFLGAGGGGLLIKQAGDHHPTLVSRALTIEVVLTAVAAIVAGAVSVRAGHVAADGMIAALAFAMGLRSAVVRRLAVPDLPTTVLTMTLTALASQSRLAGGSGEGSVRRLTAVVAMFAGALVGALLLKTELFVPLGLAAGLALITWLAYVPAAARRGAKVSP